MEPSNDAVGKAGRILSLGRSGRKLGGVALLPCYPLPSALSIVRDKHIDRTPRVLPVDLAQRLMPGTLAHAAHHLLAHAVDLTRFDVRFRYASAYPPVMRMG